MSELWGSLEPYLKVSADDCWKVVRSEQKKGFQHFDGLEGCILNLSHSALWDGDDEVPAVVLKVIVDAEHTNGQLIMGSDGQFSSNDSFLVSLMNLLRSVANESTVRKFKAVAEHLDPSLSGVVAPGAWPWFTPNYVLLFIYESNRSKSPSMAFLFDSEREDLLETDSADYFFSETTAELLTKIDAAQE
jgi:hypothetical protein